MTKTTYVVVGAPGSPFIHGNRSHAEAHAEAERDAQRSAIANGTVERDAYGPKAWFRLRATFSPMRTA